MAENALEMPGGEDFDPTHPGDCHERALALVLLQIRLLVTPRTLHASIPRAHLRPRSTLIAYW